MAQQHQTTITKDAGGKQLTVVREFNGTNEQVWDAWTNSEILDKWWAPKPWKANTKSMDFREGGSWLYYMGGPEGEKQWCRLDYLTIDPIKSYTAKDAFCDEAGNTAGSFPSMLWKNEFTSTGTGTKVTIVINFDSEADRDKIIEMGFEEGFTAAHGNLDALLAR